MNSVISDEIRQLAREFIHLHVAGGFADKNWIMEAAFDYLEGKCDFDVLEPYIVPLTEELLAEHCREQATWSEVTDCDRLDSVFKALESEGVVARHNFSWCLTDGHAEIWGDIREIQKKRSVDGYVFYHEQDTECVVKTGKLYLAYGAVEDSEDARLDVARRIVAVLHTAGLQAEWCGKTSARITVTMDWKHRREC